MAFPGVSKRYFPPWTPHVLFCQNTHKTGNNALEKSQTFHYIAQFECFRALNLVKHAFNVIQNWKMNTLQFYSKVPIFCSSYGRRR